jgi:hypothetical protein
MDVFQLTNNTRFNLVTNFEDDIKPAEDDGTSSRSVNDDLARR